MSAMEKELCEDVDELTWMFSCAADTMSALSWLSALLRAWKQSESDVTQGCIYGAGI